MAYLTNTELKTYLGVTGAGDDTLLTNLISYAQKAIESYTGRVFEAAADTTRKFTVGEDTDEEILFFDEDLCAITSIITDADGSSPVTLTTAEYVTQPRNTTPYYAIKLLPSCAHSWTYSTDPQTGITVTGKWAWSTTVPNDIKHACTRLAAYFYRQKDAGVYDTTAIPDAGVIQVPQGIPRDVQLILNPYVRQF